jgi:hypothetical protein
LTVLTAIALLMVLFGLAEIVTAFTHDFFGISTALGATSAIMAAAVGALYAIAGLLVLTRRKWATALALLCLVGVIAGRLTLVATGMFSLETSKQIFAIIAGTTIALAFAIYIGSKWRSLQ